MVPLVSTMLVDISVFVLRGTLGNTVIKVHVFIRGSAVTESFSLNIEYRPQFHASKCKISCEFKPGRQKHSVKHIICSS